MSILIFSLDNKILNWFCFVPVLFLIENIKFKNSFLFGAFYGFFSYFFNFFWLKNFSVTDLILCSFLYLIFLGFLFVILKSVFEKSNKFTELKLFFILCIFEFIKTKGFLGFSYGILGYSQYENLKLIQISDIFGVWAVDFLMIFNSVMIYKILKDLTVHSFKIRKILPYCLSFFSVLIIYFIYGFYSVDIKKSDNSVGKIKICAVQNNVDPWKSDLNTFEEQIDDLMNLSKIAVEQNPDLEIIVWPETAVIPAIEKNYYENSLTDRKLLILKLLNFINSQKCSFLIGNFNSTENGDFNSAYFFIPHENVIPPTAEFYSKIHLVPFSENFPKFLRFWPLNLLFSEEDLWNPGNEYKVFSYKNLKFSVPICFEDNFGSDLTNFSKNGANCFINISNDSWAGSKKAQIQHLKMAVFRSVENKIPTVRSTSSGETCFISVEGKIYSKIESFTKGFSVDYVEFFDSSTFYSKFPDILPIFMILIAFFYIIFKIIYCIIKKNKVK